MSKASSPCRIFYNNKNRFIFFTTWICLSTLLLYSYVRRVSSKTLTKPSAPVAASPTKTFTKRMNELENISRIQEIIKMHNEKQFVRNMHRFGSITNDTIVIVIQTNKRKVYLNALIDSLQDSIYIEDTLLIFSHGCVDDDINKMVENITFTRVMQIFFPHSLQTHPNTFPGFTPGDCPLGFSKDNLPKNCYGVPRNFHALQIKHHWWWKINFVFNHLLIMRGFQGLVLFLEEDYYVFPDILHVLRLMRDTAPSQCPDCNVFGVGLNPQSRYAKHYEGKSDKVSVKQWNNMGFAFTRQFWQGLDTPRCRAMFCEYDDYNWDFTLAYLSHKCLPQEIKPLTVDSPRVYHIGDCGTHFQGNQCSTKSLDEARRLQKSVNRYLFPEKLAVYNTNFKQLKVDGHNGGWSDPRDVQLCKNITGVHQG